MRSGLVVLDRMDMAAREGGRSSGEEDIVVVMRERRTFVRGRTANGAGFAMSSGSEPGGPCCRRC